MRTKKPHIRLIQETERDDLLKSEKKKKKKNTLSPVKKFLANTQLSEFRFNQFYCRGFAASIDLLLTGKESNNSMY